MHILAYWPKLVFVLVPLLIVITVAVVLVAEHLEPETKKAIRQVRESSSRKENFTIQQYLYTTVYYRRDNGEPITIGEWRAEPPREPNGPTIVEFSYADSSGKHVATWEASLARRTVTPTNDLALELSWH